MKSFDQAFPPLTYFFFNLGCPKNLEDAERAAYELDSRGWKEVSDPSLAYLLVITTCAFIPGAEEESVGEILRVIEGKQEWQKLAVLGCLVSREGRVLPGLFPEVDCFMDVGSMRSLAVRPEIQPDKAGKFTGRAKLMERPEIPGRRLFSPPHLAYLKIAEGCSNHCSYCIIPSLRGGLKSRDPEGILDEAESLSRLGVKEIVIIAQDTSSWGHDLRGNYDLESLLRRMKEIVGDMWLRLMYLHPAHIDPDSLLELIGEGVILPYLDIPVQHASDSILKRMGRGYRSRDLNRIFDTLRSGPESMVLRTTVMVGFPGENRDDYSELVSFMERFEFDHAGVFEFAPMRGTPAASLKPPVPEEESRFRRDEIMDLQMDISQSRLSRLENRRLEILVDETIQAGMRPAEHIWGAGRYYGQCYEIDGVCYLSGRMYQQGSMVTAEVRSTDPYNLFCYLE